MLDQAFGGAAALGLAKAYGAQAFGPAALNSFFLGHIQQLQASEVDIVARSGVILDAVTAGYGIGYVAPVAVIAAGQLMLGNTFGAMSAVATAVTFTNPAAATCAAIGALFYGYQALSDAERAKLLETLERGLEVGRELISSLISFVENRLAKLLDSQLMKSLHGYVSEYAAMFGRTVADITRSVGDRAVLMAHRASAAAYDAAESVASALYQSAETAGAVGASLGSGAQTFGSNSAIWIGEASTAAKEKLLSLFWRIDPDGQSNSDVPS